MGISLQKQFIYFVVPKTGSATLRKALSQYIDIKRRLSISQNMFQLSVFSRQAMPILPEIFSSSASSGTPMTGSTQAFNRTFSPHIS
ncbi:hypothetical protein VP03_15775 [Sinorhizobium meliloti]|nr:hypothetical protein VP03_15775 [Sinorhizobium meliloti]